MKTHRISFFILVLALSALTCNLPAQAARPQTTPPPGAATPVISGTPALVTVSSDVPGVQVSIVPVPTPTLIAAKDFAALNALLADKIAILNLGQLKFIHDMQPLSRNVRQPGLVSLRLQAGSALTDRDLKDISGYAMDAAILSDRLGELSARQDKGSQQAAQSADNYAAIARTAYSLVIDAQGIRTALQNKLMPGSVAIEEIAAYGAQLWNASVTNGNHMDNPFTGLANKAETAVALKPDAAAQVQTQINADSSSLWIAQSASQNTQTLNLPAAQMSTSNQADLQTLNSLMTFEGAIDGNTALQVAGENLLRLGAIINSSDPSQPRQIQVPIHPIAVAGSEQIKAAIIPSFKQGMATVVSKNNPGDENAFIQNLVLKGEEKPDDQGKTTVQDEPALVNLTITKVVIDSLGPELEVEGAREVSYHFMLKWSTTIVAPQFTIHCKNGMPVGDYITSTSGFLTQSEEAVTSRGEFAVHCFALRGWGSGSQTTLGGAFMSVSVSGDKPKDTPTHTATPTPTATDTGTSTPAAAGKRTPTPTATPAPFTMNGTFGMNWSRGYYTSGFIHLTVDPLSGQVNGSINGEGTYGGEDKSCPPNTPNDKLKYRSFRKFSGNLVGTIDLNTGALNLYSVTKDMTGEVSTSGGCSDPMTVGLKPELALDGTVDLTNYTAKGQIFSMLDYDPGEGDWQAGQ